MSMEYVVANGTFLSPSDGEASTFATSSVQPALLTDLPPEHAQYADEARQYHQDVVVAEALDNLQHGLQAGGHLHREAGVLFCDDPAIYGIRPSDFAAIENAAYEKAGYGTRAEGEAFLENFRGYDAHEHGPSRFVIVAAADHAAGGLKPLAFFTYFEVSRHLDHDFVAAAQQYEQAYLGQTPGINIVSKLAMAPGIPRQVVPLIGLSVAATLQALANTYNSGMYVEAIAQRRTQLFVGSHLSQYIQGLHVLLNQPIEAEGPGGAPTKLLVYVPPASIQGDQP